MVPHGHQCDRIIVCVYPERNAFRLEVFGAKTLLYLASSFVLCRRIEAMVLGWRCDGVSSMLYVSALRVDRFSH